MDLFSKESTYYAYFPVEFSALDCAARNFEKNSSEYIRATSDKKAAAKKIEADATILISCFENRIKGIVDTVTAMEVR